MKSKQLKNDKLWHIIIIVILQISTFMMLDFLQIDSSMILGNIFLPLISYDIFHYVFYFNEISTPPFFNFIFSKNTTQYFKYLMLIFQMMQDIMIYFFIFIVMFQSQIIFKSFFLNYFL